MTRQSVKTFSSSLVLAALLALAGCNKDAPAADKKDADTSPGVHLDADDIKGLGLAVTAATVAHYVPTVSGYGVVTGLDAVAQSDSDLVSAEAAAAQSTAAAARARELSTGEEAAVSREQLDLAQAKAAADQAALTLARRKADAAFGLTPPWRDAAARARIMAMLGTGRAVLVHATFPLGTVSATPSSLTVSPLEGGAGFSATQIWDAPADPAVPGRSFYLLVENSGLAQGQRVAVAAPVGKVETGVRLPASALVLSESEPWVYVQTKPGTFLRQPVDISRPMPDGYFEPEGRGFSPGQGIVSNGAGLLLARETNPSTEPED